MKAAIFLGPSFAAGKAREILPEAIFRPPAAQGDLLTAYHQDGADIIGLVDGTFHQTLSVWHSEVCYLLNEGVTIFGASSMGALRAVETERFGAVGIGTVFEWYRDGKINADDEVALLHAPEDLEFAPISLALVNIRASLDRSVSQRELSADHAAQVLAVAQRIFYPDRLAGKIIEQCRTLALPETAMQAVERALTTEHVDIKHLDAVQLVHRVRDVMAGHIPRPPRVPFEFSHSTVFENLYNMDRKIEIGTRAISLQDIREHAALHRPDYAEVMRAGLDRSVVVYFASLLGLKPTHEEIQTVRDAFVADFGFDDDTQLDLWLQANGMNEDDFTEYLKEEVLCQKMRSWIMASRRMDRGCRTVLDEARMRGVFSQWAEEAVEADEIFNAFRHEPEYCTMMQEDPQILAARHNLNSPVQIKGDARMWAEEAGFEDVKDLREALNRSVVYQDVRQRIAAQIEALRKMRQTLQDRDEAPAD